MLTVVVYPPPPAGGPSPHFGGPSPRLPFLASLLPGGEGEVAQELASVLVPLDMDVDTLHEVRHVVYFLLFIIWLSPPSFLYRALLWGWPGQDGTGAGVLYVAVDTLHEVRGPLYSRVDVSGFKTDANAAWRYVRFCVGRAGRPGILVCSLSLARIISCARRI